MHHLTLQLATTPTSGSAGTARHCRHAGWAAYPGSHALSTWKPVSSISKSTYKYKIFDQNDHTVTMRALYGEQWYTPEDQYLVVGLAHCFEKGDDGKLVDRLVIEPISANSLEAMSHGAKTSYIHVFGLLLQDALAKSTLPSEFDDGSFCENYESRCDSAARTWMRPHAVDNLMYAFLRL
jgi:hypothetical protein